MKRRSSFQSYPRRESGVALVITLILLSVITFLAVTFLAVARREKNSVLTHTEQKVATLATETALEHARIAVNAAIMANDNRFDIGLLVSTNYINLNGFDPALPANSPFRAANVNFDHVLNNVNQTLNPAEALQNLANLQYSPRVPVFVTNRLAANSQDFRFYLDLNRDGMFTPTGRMRVTNEFGGYYTTDGTNLARIPEQEFPPANTLSNWFMGDPQYIGILERPEYPHSSSNKFVARFAYIVVPSGKTLDANYIHNYARLFSPGLQAAAGDGFRRNQGVGSWEINLASFLVDLNTNAWPGPNQGSTMLGTPYVYNPDAGVNVGSAFDDALSFLRYRYDANYQFLDNAGVYGNAANLDFVDVYCRSPLMSNVVGLTFDGDEFVNPRNWHGSDNPNHFFTGQDFFDVTKLPIGFQNRLLNVTTNPVYRSTYDRYTYYRLLEQLGTDSAPEPESKLNLNYVNLGRFRVNSTNLLSWTNDAVLIPEFGRRGSELFFLNAADRLLRAYSKEWYDEDRPNNFANYTNLFGSTDIIAITNIPVLVNGRFVYRASIQRALQLAANLWDATNPRFFPGSTVPMPTVFRPIFEVRPNGVYITDFVEQQAFEPSQIAPLPVDLGFTNVTRLAADPASLVFGVPLIIGARKGLPNFNEFSADSVVQITRKIELRKSNSGSVNQINQIYVIGISNVFGAEFWNSYAAAFQRPVEVAVTNYCLVELTNHYAGATMLRTSLVQGGRIDIPSGSTNNWPGWNDSRQSDRSLLVPLRANFIVVPDQIANQAMTGLLPTTPTDPFSFPSPASLPFPGLKLTITNRVVAYIRDRQTQRLIDYVHLTGVDVRDITAELGQSSDAGPNEYHRLWATNVIGGVLSGAEGISNQIAIASGTDLLAGQGAGWQNNGIQQPSGATKYQAIADFRAFLTPGGRATYTGPDGVVYNGVNQKIRDVAPFSPTWKQVVPIRYQANDPLVHYTVGEMENVIESRKPEPWSPPSTNWPTLANIGRVNTTYRPWGGNPFATGAGSSIENDTNAYNVALKDAAVRKSDDWAFPSNKLATLGWLGRVHRGTPWQTVYMKAKPVDDPAAWRNWSGNRDSGDAVKTQPEKDRIIFDLFTTAVNANATRGQLPINQTNLAAWSAVLGGLVGLTNTSTEADLDEFVRLVSPWIIDPAGNYDVRFTNTYPLVAKLVAGINRERSRTFLDHGTNVFVHTNGVFNHLGDILSVPELTTKSPLLDFGTAGDFGGVTKQMQYGMSDPMMEWLPQQMMSLLKLGEPRFVVYAYGQSLKPADRAVITASGPHFGMVTNYQVTAESVTRAVVRIDGAPDQPRAVIESFNVLPPD